MKPTLLSIFLALAACNSSSLGVGDSSPDAGPITSSPDLGQASGILCAPANAAGAPRPLLVRAEGNEIRFVLTDGSERSVITLGRPATIGGTSAGRVLVYGRNVDDPDTELALVDIATANVVWRQSHAGFGWLAPDGTVYGSEALIDDAGWGIALDGSTFDVPGVPSGGFYSEGAVLISRHPTPAEMYRQYSWWRRGQGLMPALVPAPSSWEEPHLGANGAAVYISGDEMHQVAVISRPDDVITVPLPEGYSASIDVGGLFALVQTYDPPRTIFRLDTATAQLTPLLAVPPAGLRPLTGEDPPSLSEDGAQLRAFRSDSIASIYRSDDPAGSSWTKLGLSFANAVSARAGAERAGSALVTTNNHTFLPNETWPSGPEKPSLLSPAAQLIRLDGSAEFAITDAEAHNFIGFDASGGCGLYFSQVGSRFQARVVRLADGAVRDVGGTVEIAFPRPSWLDAD